MFSCCSCLCKIIYNDDGVELVITSLPDNSVLHRHVFLSVYFVVSYDLGTYRGWWETVPLFVLSPFDATSMFILFCPNAGKCRSMFFVRVNGIMSAVQLMSSNFVLSDRNYMTWRANELHNSAVEEICFQAADFDPTWRLHWMKVHWLLKLTSVLYTYFLFHSWYMFI